eukprot:TRINITY_DN32278_c0_g1_i2.p1 TRINITY_DN32278_c0_g1~~TRINITY_DN32278_c0_g1_i2.p1  ORF type:complete len:288 (-),score=35.47 TRINITY_DN32278_c0_g1_i2:19-882(-)
MNVATDKPLPRISTEGELLAELLERPRGYSELQEELPSFRSDPFCRQDAARLRRELPQLLVALFVYCVGVYTNSVTQAYLQKHANWFHRSEAVLWDFGFKNFPQLDIVFIHITWKYWSVEVNLPDFMAGLATIYLLVRFLVIPGPLSMRWTILRRLLFLSGVMFFLRAFSIVSTVLPNPDSHCKCQIDNRICTKEDLENIWWFALQVFVTSAVTCEDVLFSGHTVAVTISLMFVLEYSHKAPWFSSNLDSSGERCNSTVCTLKVCSIAFAMIFSVLFPSREAVHMQS